jgi:hypothetical protein
MVLSTTQTSAPEARTAGPEATGAVAAPEATAAAGSSEAATAIRSSDPLYINLPFSMEQGRFPFSFIVYCIAIPCSNYFLYSLYRLFCMKIYFRIEYSSTVLYSSIMNSTIPILSLISIAFNSLLQYVLLLCPHSCPSCLDYCYGTIQLYCTVCRYHEQFHLIAIFISFNSFLCPHSCPSFLDYCYGKILYASIMNSTTPILSQ